MSIIGSNVLAGASGSGAISYQIQRSLRFNSGDSAYLSKTPSSAGNRKTWTISLWLKRCKLGSLQSFTSSNNDTILLFDTSDRLNFYFGGYVRTSTAVFRDVSAWYHIVLAVDTTSTTAQDRARIYVNGQEITAWDANTTITQNADTTWNNSVQHQINANNTSQFGDLYIADFYNIDGQALAPTYFGELDDNNVWQPKAFAGTYGTNGFHLDFSDNSSNAALGTDTSGRSNTWTVNNLSVASGAGNDSLVDSPTNGDQADTGAGGEVVGNYATLNPLIATSSTLSNGNLDYASTATYQSAYSTIGVKTGKWYFEGTVGTFASDALIGVGYAPFTTSTYVGGSSTSWGYEGAIGRIYNNGSFSAFGSTYGAGDIIGVAFDADTGKLWFAKNGTWQASGNPATGANPAVTLTTGIDYLFGVSAGNTGTWFCNWGARPFAYTAPSGYKALCTTNFSEPTIADGSTAMDVALYTGNGSTQTISGLDFSPDLVWIKNRAQTDNHKLLDMVRGATNELESSYLVAEVANADGLTAFNSDGFALGADVEYNTNTEAYVAWTWDAGSSTVTNTDGSITSTVRANPAAGFSIVSVTEAAHADGSTVGHGLNAKPEMIIEKRTDQSSPWYVQHSGLGDMSGSYLRLNATSAKATDSTWNISEPTSSVISVDPGYLHSNTNADVIYYLFAPVDGYSSIGSYVGNGSLDGPFVYTGFRSRWILHKSISSELYSNWHIYDTARDAYNPVDLELYPNLSNVEGNIPGGDFDILSNGFKVRTNFSGGWNTSGITYIYVAFAEHPFKTARAR